LPTKAQEKLCGSFASVRLCGWSFFRIQSEINTKKAMRLGPEILCEKGESYFAFASGRI
jgi:hypothetical protein